MKDNFKNIPIALSAISLGFMGLGTAFVGFNILWVRHIAVLFSVICLGLIFLKYAMHPKVVLEEMKHPVLGSVYPTVCMTLMVIAVYFNDFNHVIGKGTWVFAIVLHFIISIFFFREMFKEFKLDKMIPGWFIPSVGIGVGAVTSGPMNMPLLSDIVFYYALAMFAIITPIMIYRLKKHSKLQGPAKSTIMIFTAPASVCLAGCLATSNMENQILVSILAILTYISIIYSYVLLPQLIREKSLPHLAPLTFPLSIGVIASQRYVKYLGNKNSNLQGICEILLYVQCVVATLVIGYVVIKAICLLFSKFKTVDDKRLSV